MKVDTKNKALSDAIDAFESGTRFWAMPLVNALEEQKRLRAIEWAISLLSEQLNRFCGGKCELENGWLNELRVLLRSELPDWKELGPKVARCGAMSLHSICIKRRLPINLPRFRN